MLPKNPCELVKDSWFKGVVGQPDSFSLSLPLFQDSLHSLMTTLGQANPYFIRCIKPNGEKVPDNFVPEMVLNQLKYSGVCGLLCSFPDSEFSKFHCFQNEE